MSVNRRVFTREFKLAAIKELEAGKSVGLVARKLEISANMLARWRREHRRQPTKAFSGQGKPMLRESREAELERKVGQMTMEIDFLKKLLERFEELRAADNGGQRSMKKSEKRSNR
jgi:transposase